MEYLSEEIRERFASDNCCPTFLEPQSVNEQELYSDGDPTEPNYYDLSEKQYTNSNFSSQFIDDSNKVYSEFNFITQMPLEVHIKSEDYEEFIPGEESLQCCTQMVVADEVILKNELRRRKKAERQKLRRAQWDDEKRKAMLERERIRQRLRRANFSEERRRRELEIGKLRQRTRRAMYTPEELERERELNRRRQRERRTHMSEEQRRKELEISKARQKMKRALLRENRQQIHSHHHYSAKTTRNSAKTETKEVQCEEFTDITAALESF